MTETRTLQRAIAPPLLLALLTVLGACGGGGDNARVGNSSSTNGSTATSSASSSRDAATGSGECALVDTNTVEQLFAIEVASVEALVKGRCDFVGKPDPEIPNVGVVVLRNELGQTLYDEFSSEVRDVGEGSGGSGVVAAGVGDDGIAAPGPNAVDLTARRGNVNVRVTAVVPSDTRLSQADLLAAAAKVADAAL